MQLRRGKGGILTLGLQSPQQMPSHPSCVWVVVRAPLWGKEKEAGEEPSSSLPWELSPCDALSGPHRCL